MTRLAALAAIVLIGAGRAASAQVPPHRIEVGGGAAWFGNAALGSSSATETTASGAPSTIFNTSTSLDSGTGVGVHVNVRVVSRLEAVLEASRGTPLLATTITNDIESSGAVTATEKVTQYTVAGGALWYLPFGAGDGRLSTFVIGTAGYLRQLHESATLAVTGQIYEAGGGVKYLTSAGRPAFGISADLRAVARTQGVAPGSGASWSPAFHASIFTRF